MESVNDGVDAAERDGVRQPQVANIDTSVQEPTYNSTETPSRGRGEDVVERIENDEKSASRVPTLTPELEVLDANSPVTNLYLTFSTAFPAVNTAGHPSQELPTPPDLSRYSDPFSWPKTRKFVMVVISCIATMCAAYSAGAYSPAAYLIADELGVSHEAALLGITFYTIGFGLAPMALAPFSEINGRYPVFVVSGFIFVLFQAMSGVVTTLAGMLMCRFVHGCGGSVFSTMVGGVIADIFNKKERNLPMALYSGFVFIGTGLGPLVASAMVSNWEDDGQKWKWVFWHQTIFNGVVCLTVALVFHESRGSVLLSRKARKLNLWYEELEKQGVFGVWVSNLEADDSRIDVQGDFEKSPTDDGLEDTEMGRSDQLRFLDNPGRGMELRRIRWVVKEDESRGSIVQMITLSLWRPLHLFITEPIVFFFSLWISFAWGILYLTFGSTPLVYQMEYGFSARQSGYIFASLVVGAVLALIIGVSQDELLKLEKWRLKEEEFEHAGQPSTGFWAFVRRRFPPDAPESRLYFTCITSIMLPIGLFIFGFSARPSVHWIVPAIGLAVAIIGIFAIYLAVFNYFADAYQQYASSAIAAQSCCRNLLGGAFPLIVGALFTNLGPSAAGGLLGSIAVALTAVPWILVFFGETIRQKSKFSTSLQKQA